MTITAEHLRILTDIVHVSGARLHADGWRTGSDGRLTATVFAITARANRDRLMYALGAAGFDAEIAPVVDGTQPSARLLYVRPFGGS